MKSCYEKEVHWYYSPLGHSCDVVCSWEQKAVVVSILSCGQVVADACHQNTDVGEGSTTDCVFNVATDTNMDLENNKIVKTKDISLNFSIIRPK